MKFCALSLAGLMLLSGCASSASINEQMSSWQGSRITEVVNSWGPPTSTFTDVDGSLWYTWKQESFNQYGSLEANRTFKVENGRVTTYRWNGQNGIVMGWTNIGKQ